MALEHIRSRLALIPARDEDAEGAYEAGVALLIAPGPQILLIRRAEHPADPWSGQIAFPGGGREACDSDLLATAIRETAEETGVTLSTGSLLGRLDDFRPRRPSLPDVLIRPFVFGLDAAVQTSFSNEVQYCLWTPLRRLTGSRGEREIEIRGSLLKTPSCLAGDGEVVWGITYRILSELFEKLGPVFP
ncbi:MAG: hypothetical protein AUJ52_09205 [Elusimicrobia bacterium CG1_02_63_36]|nr:MAG: hypothetical protein AUJ52_09205 [Elusimicrobia bacterium CG1_02_63_36]